jgi:general secretion pathway protein G
MNNTMKTKKYNKLQKGFTLIEIMVVVVIIGILATIIVPKIMDKPNLARIEKAKHDVQAISSALSLYKLDKFNYPDTNEGLNILVGKYLSKLPKDPWDKEYFYLNPGSHGDFDLYSYGADGAKGGKDENVDINNWD